MKFAIFLIMAIIGSTFATDCVQVAKENCAAAFENYNPSIRVKYCTHVKKVESCLNGVHTACFHHYYHTYEDICGPHEIDM